MDQPNNAFIFTSPVLTVILCDKDGNPNALSEKYYVHKALLQNASPELEAYIKNNTHRTAPETVLFREVHARTFEDFLGWLYFRKYRSRTIGGTGPEGNVGWYRSQIYLYLFAHQHELRELRKDVVEEVAKVLADWGTHLTPDDSAALWNITDLLFEHNVLDSGTTRNVPFNVDRVDMAEPGEEPAVPADAGSPAALLKVHVNFCVTHKLRLWSSPEYQKFLVKHPKFDVALIMAVSRDSSETLMAEHGPNRDTQSSEGTINVVQNPSQDRMDDNSDGPIYGRKRWDELCGNCRENYLDGKPAWGVSCFRCELRKM